MKKSYEACNITPLHCAAIHPSKAYLKELFEELTPAERMDNDDYGRTVAHFAAASTTLIVWNILSSKNFQWLLPTNLS